MDRWEYLSPQTPISHKVVIYLLRKLNSPWRKVLSHAPMGRFGGVNHHTPRRRLCMSGVDTNFHLANTVSGSQHGSGCFATSLNFWENKHSRLPS